MPSGTDKLLEPDGVGAMLTVIKNYCAPDTMGVASKLSEIRADRGRVFGKIRPAAPALHLTSHWRWPVHLVLWQ